MYGNNASTTPGYTIPFTLGVAVGITVAVMAFRYFRLYNDCAAIHEAIKAMLGNLDLSDPKTFTSLPFPSLLQIPSQRFTNCKIASRNGTFSTWEQKPIRVRDVWFREIKSHLLAALVYRLIREGKRVEAEQICLSTIAIKSLTAANPNLGPMSSAIFDEQLAFTGFLSATDYETRLYVPAAYNLPTGWHHFVVKSSLQGSHRVPYPIHAIQGP